MRFCENLFFEYIKLNAKCYLNVFVGMHALMYYIYVCMYVCMCVCIFCMFWLFLSLSLSLSLSLLRSVFCDSCNIKTQDVCRFIIENKANRVKKLLYRYMATTVVCAYVFCDCVHVCISVCMYHISLYVWKRKVNLSFLILRKCAK